MLNIALRFDPARPVRQSGLIRPDCLWLGNRSGWRDGRTTVVLAALVDVAHVELDHRAHDQSQCQNYAPGFRSRLGYESVLARHDAGMAPHARHGFQEGCTAIRSALPDCRAGTWT